MGAHVATIRFNFWSYWRRTSITGDNCKTLRRYLIYPAIKGNTDVTDPASLHLREAWKSRGNGKQSGRLTSILTNAKWCTSPRIGVKVKHHQLKIRTERSYVEAVKAFKGSSDGSFCLKLSELPPQDGFQKLQQFDYTELWTVEHKDNWKLSIRSNSSS